MRKKVLVPVLNRATYGRLKCVLKAIQEHPDLELQVVTGASVFNTEIDFPVLYRTQCMIEGDNLAIMPLTTSLWTAQITAIIENFNPDIVYIHGDRYENLGTALASSYLNKTIAHGEGGDVSGTIDNKVRNSITQLADIHFPISEESKKRLTSMGIDKKNIFTVGSTAIDTIIGVDLKNKRGKPYVIVLIHPNTIKEEPLFILLDAVKKIDMDVVVINPNVDPGNKQMLKLIHQKNFEFIKNLPVEDYLRLLANCQCAIGNSSSFIKEGAFLGVPAVIIGDRQENREHAGNVIFSDYSNILACAHEQIGKRYPRDLRFGNGTAGKQVAEILSKINIGG